MPRGGFPAKRHVRHIHATPGEHIQVHRSRSQKPDFRPLLVGTAIALCWEGIRDVFGVIGTIIEVTVIILFWIVVVTTVAVTLYTVVRAIWTMPKKR